MASFESFRLEKPPAGFEGLSSSSRLVRGRASGETSGDWEALEDLLPRSDSVRDMSFKGSSSVTRSGRSRVVN